MNNEKFSIMVAALMVCCVALPVITGCKYANRQHLSQSAIQLRTENEDRTRYIEFVRKTALVPKPEKSPESWYDAIPDDDIYPFDTTSREYTRRYRIVYAEWQYLSFRCEDHVRERRLNDDGWPEYTVGSIDRKTGKVVTLDDIDAFADRSLLKKRLKDAVLEKMKDEEVAARAFPHNNFYLAKDGWHFVYNTGEIDCLATGPIEVVIERN